MVVLRPVISILWWKGLRLSLQVPLQLFLQLSTKSDAQSAPPELDQVFNRICEEYTNWVGIAQKQIQPEWNMPDLVRTVIGDEAINIPGFLTETYYDVMLHGQNSWLCQDLFHFLDLINYTF